MYVDAWGTVAAGVLMDDGLTLGAYLEGFDVQVGKLQSGFDADAARAEADVPKDVAVRQVEGLERQ